MIQSLSTIFSPGKQFLKYISTYSSSDVKEGNISETFTVSIELLVIDKKEDESGIEVITISS